AVLLPGNAQQPVRVLQAPAPVTGGETLSLDSAEYGAGDQLVVSGHAAAGSHLNIYAGDKLLGRAIADSAGKWSLTAPFHAVPGAVELRLDQLAADGSVARRVAAPLEAPAIPATASASGTYTVRRGNSLWLIARHIYGAGPRYTAIYTANRPQIRDPDKIYPGQQFKLPKS
ncbi:MAG TPA: LysM peptidoglycan-binding domain-containing protein, partial [Stellaceae bacterium]|nr:LysM peptidoglycan-binding domain-containing protein [Stellaceae bacterium]